MLPLPVRQHACLQCRIKYLTRAMSINALRSPSSAPIPSSSLMRWFNRHLRSDIRLNHTSGPAKPSKKSRRPRVSPRPGTERVPGAPLVSKRSHTQILDLIQLRPVLGSFTETLPSTTRENVALEEVLKGVESTGHLDERSRRAVALLRKAFAGRSYDDTDASLGLLASKGPAQRSRVTDEPTKDLLVTLGLLRPQRGIQPTRVRRVESNSSSEKGPVLQGDPPSTEPDVVIRKTPSIGAVRRLASADHKEKVQTLEKEYLKEATLDDFAFVPLAVERSQVPGLGHDLSRVLFNPGVYQLQDPRSRVWNFDPYLGNLMPVSEFNYDALNKYITSSEDSNLRQVALQHEKRYIGSTSSMSGVLSHFHFLLSSWRELTLDHLSRGFVDDGHKFTRIQRGPTAIFLRYKDGVYAVDADKEFDSANVLMSLGRSMEKLLTNDKDEFERFRRTHDIENDSQVQSTEPEAYHYTGLGSFLIRSQLDAHDPRLPGTGMFDLKTRAVAAVRMMVRQHETGAGYQIKERFGTWESYEREYYDMMRSAFLKYSLQVRMGRMDGIFVAYHNTERLFGFQYIPLPEMDLALHGQTDVTLGDREFRLSIKLLTDIFNQATHKFPEQSLRFHFEAREATSVQAPHMYIFVEPVSDEEILEIQNSKKEEVAAFEERIFNPKRADQVQRGLEEEDQRAADDITEPLNQTVTPDAEGPGSAKASKDLPSPSNAADVEFLDSLMDVDLNAAATTAPVRETEAQPAQEPKETKPILGWKLKISNIVNGLPVTRPTDLKASDDWSIRYALVPLAEGVCQRNYALCKNRRKAVLSAPQEGDDSVRFYVKRLISMSQEGAKWRRRLDEFDAQRDRVVLYGDRSPKESTE
ncbi:mitochondrial protein Pet127-domain-containing protein [Exophiala viscosa]|uniref:Mitochondrial protein Pet127-domain-containing protein n=1 Tax=Exophiala viscosa TaxID=2486360 RepID=A0AAN6E5G1_9EURO|nr:mitochondrial protein Pet127-domain-containing protein [Exophiala viscosa]